MNTKYDYAALKQEYMEGPDSLTPRSMAKRDGAPFSAYYDQYRKDNWKEAREQYRAELQRKVIVKAADSRAEKIVAIKDDALAVIHAAILKMGMDLRDRTITETDAQGRETKRVIPGQVVTPADLSKLIDKLLVLTGSPSDIRENRNLGLDLNGGDGAGLPPAVARLIAEVAGERGSATGDVGRSPLPGSRSTRTN